MCMLKGFLPEQCTMHRFPHRRSEVDVILAQRVDKRKGVRGLTEVSAETPAVAEEERC